MFEPLLWLIISVLLLAVSLVAVFVVALPTLHELARAARSVEKLCDTLSRELPPTLESIRLTSMEISDLTDDMNEGVQSAGRVVQQVDESMKTLRHQTRQARITTRSVWVGARTAWRTFTGSSYRTPRNLPAGSQPMSLPRQSQYEQPQPDQSMFHAAHPDPSRSDPRQDFPE
ncbi:MAG: DUF948 domain-containing protein [Thainema sp.]